MSLYTHDLLARGYFPIELPPAFNTKSFSQAIVAGNSQGIAIANRRPYYSVLCSHNLVRAGGLRRNLSIPNPKHFLRLVNEITSNWVSIKTVLNKSKISLSIPVVSSAERAVLPQHNLNERSEKIAQLRANNRFVLKADITRFFPSIYTHSIPWAILGKTVAKQHLSNGTLSGTWQDNLDIFSRSMNNNQTVGIPIGPDTSRIIAEIILGEIDNLLLKKFKNLSGIRFIDDYEFGFKNISEAENVLSYFQYLLNEYELGLNPSKTKIIKLPDSLEPIWTSKIRTFVFRNINETSQKNDLISYFGLVFDFITKYPDEGIMKYAIARLKSEIIKPVNWKLFDNILSNCILIEPACLPQVTDQLLFYKNQGYKPNKIIWQENLNRIIYEKVPLGHSSEASWAMWLLKLLNLKMNAKTSKIVDNTDDSIVGLMGLGLASIGLTQMKYFANIRQYSSPNYKYESQWLLFYQGNYMNFFSRNSRSTNLVNDPFYDFLQNSNVSFFDINTVQTSTINYNSSSGLITSGGGGGGY